MPRVVRARPRHAFVAVCAAALLAFAYHDAVGQEGAAATPIPVPEIARRAEDVVTQLRQSTHDSLGSPVIGDVEGRLPAMSERIRGQLASTARVLASSPSPNALGNLTESWRITRAELVAWNDALTVRATALEQRLRDLDRQRATWSATRDAALASGAPTPVLERVVAATAAIAASREAVDEGLTRVLRVQDNVVRNIAHCDRALAGIERARSEAVGPLFARDAPPVWSSRAETVATTDVMRRLRESVLDDLELTRRYLANHLGRAAGQAALFVVALALARLARVRARRETERPLSEATASQVFEAPVAAALLFALLATEWIYPDAPGALVKMVGALTLVPTVLVVRRLSSPTVLPVVWALGGFVVVDSVRDICSSVPEVERWIFFLEMMFGIGCLAFALRSRALASAAASLGSGGRAALRWIVSAQLAILLIALVVGALGYERLAHVLSGHVLASSYVALVLYAGLRVAEVLVAGLLRVGPLQGSFAVRHHRDLLLRRTHGALRWSCIAAWVYVALDRLNVMSPLGDAAAVVFAARYVRGALSLSVGDVVAFAGTIWAACLVSAFVRFVLHEDVYPRIGLSRGAPLAVSTLIHYVILLVGLVLAGASLSLDFNRITILAGAFSLGVGLGLQGIVANWVSGLILLLERKINVGDAVQVDDLMGKVLDIGFRASTIRTADGAEVVVANSSLTSERVINWTLSDRMRRVTVPVSVDDSCDSARVAHVLRALGEAHPKALREPPPSALCVGVGANAIHFELRVWSANFEDAESLRSDLAITVHAALRDAGVPSPASRRDTVIASDLVPEAAVSSLARS